MRASVLTSSCLATTLVVAAGTGEAQERVPAPEKQSEARHEGLFLRATVALPWVAADDRVDGRDVELSGPGGIFALAIGNAVTEHAALFCEVYVATVPGPSAEIDEVRAGDVVDTWYAVGGVGLGVVHYFSSDIHLSVSLGAGKGVGELRLGNGRLTRVGTAVHPSIHAVVGHDWSLGGAWGLGLGLDALLLSGPDPESDGMDVHVLSLGLAVSLTYY